MESPLQQVTWNCRFRVRKTQEWGKVEMTRKTLPTHACFCNNPFIFFLPTRSTSFSFMEPEPEALLRNYMAKDASTTLLDSHDILLNTAVTTCFKMLKLSSPLSVSLVCFSSGICALEFWAEPEQEITGQFWEKKIKKIKGHWKDVVRLWRWWTVDESWKKPKSVLTEYAVLVLRCFLRRVSNHIWQKYSLPYARK